MDLARIAIGWAVVWAFGILLARRLDALHRVDAADPHPAWIAGTGFLAGAFVLTLVMRLVSVTGMHFGVLAIGAPLAIAGVLLAIPDIRATRSGPIAWRTHSAGDPRLHGALRVLWFIVLAWLIVRGALLAGEVVRTPLYPWDAWTQWGTKAKVWFELRSMVPFTFRDEWLQGASTAYFDAAPHYPATVPLWQVWSALLLGRWDDALINLPWWLLGVALALLIYGFLRDHAVAPLTAMIGTWMIVSMPIVETHVALAGYADLPLAAYLTAAGLAGLRAVRRRSIGDVALALLFMAALPMIKNPGWVWMGTLLAGALVVLLPRRGLQLVVALWAAGVAVASVLGRYDTTVLGYRLHFELHVPWQGLKDAYFSFANWHLLFWLLPPLLLATRRFVLSRELAPLTAVIGSGVLFLLLGFSFSSASIWVEDQSTVNRATLHLAPLLGVWLVLLVDRALAADPSSTAAAPAVDEASAPVAVGPADPAVPLGSDA